MRLVNSSYEILDQPQGLDGIYKQIEIAGRTCYKSEDKITPDSAKSFVDRMIKSGHGAMLEHGTVYLQLPMTEDQDKVQDYLLNKYTAVNATPDSLAVTTNFRVLVENKWLDDLKYLCEPTDWHRKRVCVRFVCDRGVSHELVRHRVFSFAQESTRYCNYSKEKFGKEVTFIVPAWFDDERQVYMSLEPQDLCGHNIEEVIWKRGLIDAERLYFTLMGQGWSPQQARSVLPNALKTEIVVTGFTADWQHFFELRDSERAHPDMYALAHPLHQEFISRKLF